MSQYNVSIETKKLQEHSLKMFKVFIEVCEKLNLKYYVLGGTILGAVRHKGFIPWDDDIDVGMPREDYEIFISKAQEFLPKNYFVQTFKTDPEWPANFAKIRNSDTTFIESSVKNRKINHGIYIDVFPLDRHEDNKFKLKIFNFKNKFYQATIARCFYIPKQKRNWKWYFIRILTFFVPVKTALKKREKLLKSNKGTKYLANYCGAWGVKEIVPSDWYGKGAELEFEGIKIIAPANYDAWLAQVYGDYMQLPPVEKRVTHHFNEVIDLEKSYKEYIK